MSAPLLIHQRLLSKTAPSMRAGASHCRDDFRPTISLAGASHDKWRRSASEHQPEQREHPVPVLSRRVGHRRVHYPKRTGQRDAQPAEQLWQQLLGGLGERNVPRWVPHHLAQQLAGILGLLELVELAHSFLNALGDRKVLRHDHVTTVPLGRIASGYGNVIDLLVDELPEATYVVLVDLDACDRAEEPFEHRNTRRMGHALPPVHRSRLARPGQHFTLAFSSATPNRTRRCNLARPVRPNRSIDTRERTSEDVEDSRWRAICRSGVPTLNGDFRSAGPVWGRARLPTIISMHIGPQWLIPLPVNGFQ